MADPSLEYRNRFLKRQLQYDAKFRKIFNKVAEQFSLLSMDPNIKFAKSFSFGELINKKIDVIIKEFHQDVLNLTETEIEKSWGLSNEKNDLIVKDYLSTIGKIKAAQRAKYFMPNIPALKAFISGKRGTETLSQTVWQIAKQTRQEMVVHLGIGLANGDSAQTISRRIRQYLTKPDALFRRVRDKNGKLVASKPMLANKPGTGTYNSAYKNALRTTRTNTNQAYLYADHLRWMQLDMVIGVRISLSAQHKVEDICDELIGVYPKTFIWVGWHPQDLCHATPVMIPKEDFKKYLKGETPLKAEQIKDMPENFKKHIKANYDRYSNYKSTPYFIEDNLKVIIQILKEK